MSDVIAELVALTRRFLNWWLGELFVLVPEGLRKRLRNTGETLVFVPSDSEAEVYLEGRNGLKALGRFDVRPDAHPRQKLRAALEGRGLSRAAYGGKLGVCIRIPAKDAARTVADLPLAAEENLGDVVSFELNRHTPFNADQAVFSYRIVGRDTTVRRLRVELIVVPIPIFERYVRFAHEFDLSPDRIEVAEPDGKRSASGNLLHSAAAGTHRTDTLTYALTALCVCLAVVALYLPVHATQQRANLVARQFTERKAAIEEVARLEKAIAAVRQENNFLIDRKLERPSVSELLLDTTHVLPDDTWLQDWRLTGSQVLLTGYARSASALVPLLEQSHIFKGTNFRSPVTQDPRTGRERFDITANIVRKEKP